MKRTLQYVAAAAALLIVAAPALAQDPPATQPPVEELPVPQAAQELGQQPANEGAAQPRQDSAPPPSMGVMLGQSAGGGVLITDVRPGGPAYNAGLRRGDYLLKVGSQDVSDPDAVAGAVAEGVVDDRIQLVIWRDARRQDWTVDLRNAGPAPDVRAESQAYRGPQRAQNSYYYGNGRAYDRNRYYGSTYGRTRPYNDPAYRFGYYYNDPYRGWNNRYPPGWGPDPFGYPYGGNGLYLNGRGRGGLQVGGFGIRW